MAVLSCSGLTEWLPMQAQSPAQAGPAAFEVASIRPHPNAEDSQETNLLPGGRYVGINTSVRKLIRLALGVEDNQMLGAPGWVDSAHYDIDAKTGESTRLEPPEFQRLLLALLVDRFDLKFHRETRERSVYWLVAQKGGQKLKEHKGTEGLTMSVNASGTKKVLEATKISMGDLAGALTRQTGRPMEDRTGITGEIDVRLEWDDGLGGDSTTPSIFTALEEQLGLKVNPAKGKVEVIVIDHVEKPSEN